MPLNSLTADERIGLERQFNLSDAHTYHSMGDTERESILQRFPEIFLSSNNRSYKELETSAAAAYGNAIGQAENHSNLVCATYSSSVSLMIIARFLRRTKATTTLTTPTFDNLRALLRDEGVSLIRTSLSRFTYQLEDPSTPIHQADAHLIVSPNNPTGEMVHASELEMIAKHCKANGQLIIFDHSFKAHEPESCYDYYSILEEFEVDYIVIEDTGKIWPVRDLKASFIHASKTVRPMLRKIADDVLLNIAPFILQLVEEYSTYSKGNGFRDLRQVIDTNRSFLRDTLERHLPDVHKIPYPASRVGVEVVEVPWSAASLASKCGANGLAVLDCSQFFWDGARRTQLKMIRIALLRDPSYFQGGCELLVKTMKEMVGQ